jgi:hypothetical protein
MNWIKTGNEYRPSGLIRVNKCYLTRADLRRPPLYPSEIRVHVDASLTGCSGEPRLAFGYPEGADQGKKLADRARWMPAKSARSPTAAGKPAQLLESNRMTKA